METNQLAIEHSTNVKAIDKKIFEVIKKAPIIRKEADNPYFKSKYAEYPEIQAKVRPLVIEQELMVNFMPVMGNKLTMFVKDITSAEFYKVTADLNMGAISPQAQGSAITYLKRYMLTAFFDLQIEDAMDDDGNAGSGKQSDRQQAQRQPQNNTTPPADLNWLDENTDKWFAEKWAIFNNSRTIADIKKKYKVSKKNADKIVLQEELTPGTVYWNTAVKSIAKGKSTADNIKAMFTFTGTNEQDLFIDAENAKKELSTTNTTK